ncbi:MAG: Uncharacterized protein G01um10145_171 [Microgenomates group bacterium Gr01-1014_5]|nr:MAG: Uncharacterized protein G01um10145_171 [Microgenomates group bacterium Gr01-1014_5]
MIILILFGLLSFQLFLLANLQFTAWPEMLSYPYLRNEGFLLYKDMIHPYPPLLTMFLSFVYKLFGYDVVVLKTVAWTIILFSSSILYYVANYITGKKIIALISVGFYVLIQPFLEGNMLWFDMAIVPPVLLGTYFALRWIQEKNDNFLLLTSFFLSAAALIKQTTALFLIILGMYVIFRGVTRGGLVKLAFPPLILLTPFVIRLVQEQALQDFINWTILYPLGEWGKFSGYVQMSLSGKQVLVIIILLTPILLYNIILPAIAALRRLQAGRRKIFSDTTTSLLLTLLLVSLVMVYPRFSFFHLQLALAFIVLNLALIVKSWDIKKVIMLFSGVVLLLTPFVHKPVLAIDWQKDTRFYETKDIDLANKIANIADHKDKVFFLGLHSGLYVIADRLPSKRWTDNFSWYLEIPGVQEEIVSRWEQNPPVYVFWRQPSVGNSFDLGVYQPKKIVEYVQNHYNFESELVPGVQTWKLKKD